jgi:hypothetical protein
VDAGIQIVDSGMEIVLEHHSLAVDMEKERLEVGTGEGQVLDHWDHLAPGNGILGSLTY